MASSDIYEVKEPSCAKKEESAVSQQSSRHRRRRKRFDEAVDENIASTNRRRSQNSGFRRFKHRMKDPKFSKKFWMITLSSAGLILILLIVWDRWFRWPQSEQSPEVYRIRSK